MPALLVYVMTALAAAIVVLTRLRRRTGQSGRHRVGPWVLALHTYVGALAVLLWVAFLLAPEDTVVGGGLVGIVAIGCWWLVSMAGLLMLTRWLPSRGRHANDGGSHSWFRGPGLSLLAHLGMGVAVLVLTWGYLTRVV